MPIILAFEARYLNASMVAYNQTKHSMLCVVLHLVQSAVIMWLHELCKMSMLWYSTFCFVLPCHQARCSSHQPNAKTTYSMLSFFCIDASVVWFGSIRACKNNKQHSLVFSRVNISHTITGYHRDEN